MSKPEKESFVTEITPRSLDFSKWYLDVVRRKEGGHNPVYLQKNPERNRLRHLSGGNDRAGIPQNRVEWEVHGVCAPERVLRPVLCRP